MLRARGEVILAGGAINSPQLLQLSGIGLGAVEGLGIPVAAGNANVGDHLSDHQGVNYTWSMQVPTYNDELRPWRASCGRGCTRWRRRAAREVDQPWRRVLPDTGRHGPAQHAAVFPGVFYLIRARASGPC